MAVPNTFTAGTVAVASEVNANFTYLDSEAPQFTRRERATTATSIPNSTLTTVLLNLAVTSLAGGHWTSTEGTDTIVTPGLYRIGAGVLWELNATGYRRLRILVNANVVAGVVTSPGVGIQCPQSAAAEVVLAASDVVKVEVDQNSGAALNVLNSTASFRTVTLLRPNS